MRVVQAFEAGAVLNPDGLKNQNEGAIVQGIGSEICSATGTRLRSLTMAPDGLKA